MTNSGTLAAVWIAVICGVATAAGPLRLDFSPSPLQRLLERTEAKKLTLPCPRCAKPPNVDGKLDDPAWRDAALIKGLSSDAPATRVRLCFDDKALYIGAECSQRPGVTPTGKARPRDTGAWKDDCIEAWIDPGRKNKVRFQFVVSVGGAIYDQIMLDGAEDPSYNPDWAHAANQGERKWSIEMAIPLKALQLERWPRQINFNIGRNGPHINPRAWYPTYGDSSGSSLILEGVAIVAGERQSQSGATVLHESLSSTGRSLAMSIEKPVARPGDRWIEAKLTLSPLNGDPAKTRIQAALFDLTRAEPVATASAVPGRSEGRLWVNLRQVGLEKARVSVQLVEGGRCTGAAEAFLSARRCETPLDPGHKIAVDIDVPEGIEGVREWPIAFGVPFAAGTLWDAEQVRLVDRNGREMPSQKEVTARWDREGAIKWVRFDALVSSEHGCFVQVTPRTARAQPATPIHVTERAGKVEMNTGAARYLLAKGPSPIQEVWLGKNRVAASAGTRGLYVVDQNGRMAQASADGETMRIEARGPVAACVRFEGFYRTADGEQLARHITRVEAFAGQSFAKVTHTLVLTNDTNKIWFKDIGWEFAVQPGSDPAAVFGASRDDPSKSVIQPLSDAIPSAFMLQDSHYRFAHGTNHFGVATATADGAQARTILEGTECGDWALLTGGRAGLVLSCREAARQHPKEFQISRDKIVLRLFSNRGGEELDFRAPALLKKWDLSNWFEHIPHDRWFADSVEEAAEKVRKLTSNAVGWAKTHQLLIAPLSPREPAREAARLSKLHSTAVYALVDPYWIYKSEVMDRIHPKDTERFPQAEKVIEETFNVWEGRIGEWGEYGFIDYFSGPRIEYSGKYAMPYRYNQLTYTLRSDLWLAYARSGERRIRAYAEATNRAYLDNVFCHWDGGEKVRGLYMIQTGLRYSLPFYWEGYAVPNMRSSSNLENFIFDYHLTGYRRAKDHVLEYADGLKRFWTPEKARRDGKILMTMRLASQAHALTWDPELRAIVEAGYDTVADPDGNIGLTKKPPRASSAYKTQVDIKAVLDMWRIYGTTRYRDLAVKLCNFWWPRFMEEWPIFYVSPMGRMGSFMYQVTGNPAYVQVLAIKLREAGTAYNPETGKIINSPSGRIGAEDSTFVFQGIPYAQDLMVRTNADREPVASWVAYEDFGYPTSVVVHKEETDSVEIDLKTAAPTYRPLGEVGGVQVRAVHPETARNLDHNSMQEVTGRIARVRVPKDAPKGGYEIVPGAKGSHLAVAHSATPMVLHAPEYWRPNPPQSPRIRWYFKVPEGSKDAQIFLEVGTKLFESDGRPWLDGKPLKGWINLPADRHGLWSFEPEGSGLIRVRNLPPFFAAESPKSYFTPRIPWEREEIPPPSKGVPAATTFIPGAIKTPGNQALYLRARRGFRLEAGPAHPSGDGTKFLPFKQGTIEFFMKPDWSSFDLPRKSYTSLLTLKTAHEPWELFFGKHPSKTGTSVDCFLRGVLRSKGKEVGGTEMSRWDTIIEPHQWIHVAWVWGVEERPDWRRQKRLSVLSGKVFVNGKLGRNAASDRVGHVPAYPPNLLRLGCHLAAAYDELHISDIQRYTGEFQPPQTRELDLDEHTRALFHFNGDIQGESFGHKGPLPVTLDPPQ